GNVVMPMSETERRLRASIAAHEAWAATEDRTARTAPARRALQEKFLREAGGDPVRAEHLRRADYQRLAPKSARARRKAGEDAAEAQAARAVLQAMGGAASRRETENGAPPARGRHPSPNATYLERLSPGYPPG